MCCCSQVWNNKGKWWQKFHFWVIYSFKMNIRFNTDELFSWAIRSFLFFSVCLQYPWAWRHHTSSAAAAVLFSTCTTQLHHLVRLCECFFICFPSPLIPIGVRWQAMLRLVLMFRNRVRIRGKNASVRVHQSRPSHCFKDPFPFIYCHARLYTTWK